MADYTLQINIVGRETGITEAAAGIDKIGNAAASAGTQTESFFSRAAASAAGFVAAFAVEKITSGLSSFAAGTVNIAADFQQSMSVLQAASGATDAQMKQLSSTAMALGNDMSLPGTSANDAATAMLELSKAGLTVDQAMAAAKGTLQLAAAAETDAGTAAAITAGALNAFGLSGEQAIVVADQLAAGANASAASITDLSQGFQQAGAAFSGANQNTDDLITSLAMLTNVGLTGSDAGTALKNAMMQLQAPTDAAAKVMQQYGINVRDSSGNMLPMREIIGVLQEKMAGLSPAARDAALKTMLLGDGLKAMTPLINAGTAGFDAMKAKVNEAGAAQAMAAAQTTGFNGAMGALGNSVQTLQMTIGTALLPSLTGIVMAVANGINTIQSFAQSILGASDPMLKLAQVIGSVSPALGDIANYLIAVARGSSEANAWLSETPALFQSIVGAVQSAASGLQSFGDVLQTLGTYFAALAGEAVAWGGNIVSQLAAGMMAAAEQVVSVLMDIGAVIAGWLMPGSPPKLLPELDTWGAGAMSAYMEGWAQGDFSVFNSISDTIKNALDGIAKSTGDKGMNVAGMVLGSQDDIANAINEIHNLGSVSESTFQNIIAAAGPAGPQVEGLVRAYLDLQAATQDVARAQDELNSVTSQYAAQLDPLNAQLKGIQGQKQQIQDQQRLIKLQEEAGKAAAGSAEQQIALLEIQELQTKMNIRSVEQERDVAVGAAQEKLEAAKQEQAAAKARVDQQKAMIDAQNKTNALIGEQAKALAGAASSMASAAGGMAGMSAAAVPLQETLGKVNTTLDTVNTGVTTVQQGFQGVGTAFAPVEPVVTTMAGAMASFATAATTAGTAMSPLAMALAVLQSALAGNAAAMSLLAPPIQMAIQQFFQLQAAVQQVAAAFSDGGLEAGFAKLAEMAPAILTSLGEIRNQILAWALSMVPELINVLGSWTLAFLNWALELAPSLISSIGTLTAELITIIGAAVPPIIEAVGQWAFAFADFAIQAIPIAITSLAQLIAAIVGAIMGAVPGIVGAVGSWVMAFIAWLPGASQQLMTGLSTLIAGLLAWAGQQVPAIAATLASWASAFGMWAATAVPMAITAVGEVVQGLLSTINAALPGIIAMVSTWATAFAAWAPGAISEFLNNWPGILSTVLDAIANAVGPILAQLGTWAVAFVTWIPQALPGIVAGLGQIVVAIVYFIASTVGVIASKIVVWAGAFLGWVATNVLPAIPGLIGSIVGAIVKTIASLVGTILKSALALGKGIVDGVLAGVANLGKMLGDKLKSMASSAMSAAKSALGIHSPSTVFAQEIGMPIVEGIAQGIEKAGPKAVTALLDVAQKLFDTVSKGAEAFGKLADLAAIPKSGITQFTDSLAFVAEEFARAQNATTKQMQGDAVKFAELTGKIMEQVGKGVDALSKMADLSIPARDAIGAFADALALVVSELSRVAQTITKEGLTAATVFMTGAGAIFDLVGKGVDAIAKLALYEAPPKGAIASFSVSVWWLVSKLAEVSGWISKEGVGAAATFSAGAGKVLEMVSKGVDGILKLADYVKPAKGVTEQFAVSVWWVVTKIGEVSGWIGKDALKAAATFTDAAGKVIDLISKGVDAFTKLGDYVKPAAGVTEQFAVSVWWTVQKIAEVAGWIGAQGLAAAARFAESAGKVLDIISKGVDAFKKLGEFVSPSQESVWAFAHSVNNIVVAIWDTANDFTQVGVEAAARFAEGAGKVLDIIGKGADGLRKLTDFISPSQDAVWAFAHSVNNVVVAIWDTANDFTQEGVDAAARFAESAGKVLSIVGQGVDGITRLADFVSPSMDAVWAFAHSVNNVVVAIWDTANDFTQAGVDAAAKFAESAGKVVGVLKNGVDGFAALAQLKTVGQESIQAFTDMVKVLMNELISAASAFSIDALEAAKTFAEAAAKSVGILEKGVEGFLRVDSFSGVSEAALQRFADGLKLAVQKMIDLSALFTVEALAAAKNFAAVAEQSVEFLKKGAIGFDRLGEMKVTPGTGLDAFAAGLVQLINTMIKMGSILTGPMLVEANRLALGIDNILTVVQGAIKGFSDIADMVSSNTLARVSGGIMAGAQNLLAGFKAQIIPPTEDIGKQVGPAFLTGVNSTMPAVMSSTGIIGRNLAMGIANGITSGTPAIVNAVIAAVNMALAAARAALGIASPSKVFEEKIGAQMSAGMAKGIVGAAPMVEGAVGMVSGRAVGGVGSTTNNTNQSINITVNAAPGQDAQAVAVAVRKEFENWTRRGYATG